ncbi:phytase [Mycena olivaceomarginata]|nr:phytase [Mycena olivaceomarginata]
MLRTFGAFELQKSWGVYSPFHAAEEYTPLPAGCEISQLQRHGARLPTEHQTEDILPGVQKLQSAEFYTDSRLDFLDTFVYSLGENLLVPLGAIQSFESGKTALRRYASLVTKDDLPFVRASGMSRVIETAKNWTAAAASHGVYNPRLSLIINEATNDTLQDNNSTKEMTEWLDVFGPPITARLNSWAPGANLTNEDIHGLMMLCAFHTVASVPYGYTEGSPLPFSPFCSLFTPSEFESFEYSSDLDKYYSTGFVYTAGALGRVQGVGYVNELLARLTNSPAHRVWRASEIMTFSTRMVVEKLTCERSVRGRDTSDSYIRILFNEKKGPWRGLCQFDAFLESQAYSRNDGEGDWEKCFVE